MAVSYRHPCPGGSLLLSFTPRHTQSQKRTILIFGTSRLAANRAFQCLEADYDVLVIQDPDTSVVDEELLYRMQEGQIRWANFSDDEFGLYLDTNADILETLALVTITDTLISSTGKRGRSPTSAAFLARQCRERRIPINVADMPQLCDFTFPSTHRFPLAASNSMGDRDPSPLQIAVTTNASSCRLASRIRRQLVASLPTSIGSAVARVQELRDLVRQKSKSNSEENPIEEGDSWLAQHINKAVVQRSKFPRVPRSIVAQEMPDTPPLTPPLSCGFAPSASHPAELDIASRMRFIAQISEYWPFDSLSKITDAEALSLLEINDADTKVLSTTQPDRGTTAPKRRCSKGSEQAQELESRHALSVLPARLKHPSKQGRIYLVGSGPGSPQLLTRAAYTLLTSQATLILSDKLVPEAILALVPKHIPLIIAKKFPGNAEGAQSELIDLALEGARKGETVVRLKQGDIYLYGRGGEEVLKFREAGFESVVVPGLSSVLAGPTLANIPVTQRGVAETMIVCTGVGRGGKGVALPGYDRSRTAVILMGVARIEAVVNTLTSDQGTEGAVGREGGGRDGPAYPKHTPIAVIERASSHDQRVISSTLEHIVAALARLEEQRAPAMMVVGWSVMCLAGVGDVQILDAAKEKSGNELEDKDRWRIQQWLGDGNTFLIDDGIRTGLAELE